LERWRTGEFGRPAVSPRRAVPDDAARGPSSIGR